jgi:hypothetical protein
MGSVWTVKPEPVRLEGLFWQGHEFWLEVKRRLTEGERRRMSTAGFRSVSGPGTPERPGRIGEQVLSYTRTLTYLLDWSLLDERGNKLALTRDTLEQLDPDFYAAVEAALNEHVERMEQEKKARTGDDKPSLISA